MHAFFYYTQRKIVRNRVGQTYKYRQEYSFETVMMSVYPLSVSIKGKFGHLELRAPMKKRDAYTRKKSRGVKIQTMAVFNANTKICQ